MFAFWIAVVSSTLALKVRFDGKIDPGYAALSLAFALCWVMTLWLSGANDVRNIGAGPDEVRKVLTAGASLTAGLAILSYAVNAGLPGTFLLIAMPSVTVAGLIVRHAMRRRLQERRTPGRLAKPGLTRV